jgi:Golgi nucleoside diphosphatase
MISDKLANEILENIRNLLKLYPFRNTYDDVSIMDGKYEGIYSWLTLNYALSKS